jgi:glycosyltransferase involved in cell wall biosynthesis
MPGLRLWMVGDGSERKKMESLATELGISSQVMFWGQQLDVTPFFSAADAFIMSSTSEGLPVSLLQAFSVGLPAIVTDVGGMAEVVRPARAGATVPISDPDAMAAAILRMAFNNEEREQYAANAKEAFASQFTLQAMVDSYMDLYRNTPRTRRTAKA